MTLVTGGVVRFLVALGIIVELLNNQYLKHHLQLYAFFDDDSINPDPTLELGGNKS